ncbi:hypothetical protein M3Y99_01534800 [Aphelenchoides fujianensis]|nr:hypothetical protein M3Y99_01534800 [Aphelenchoides fujianensis]
MNGANAMAGWEIQALGASLGVGRPFAYGEFVHRFRDVWAEDFEKLARAWGFPNGLEALRSSHAFFVNEQTIRVVDDERVGRELAFVYEQRRKNRPPPTATNSRPAADDAADLPPVSSQANGGRREVTSLKQVPAFVLNEVTIFNENFDTSFTAGFKRLEHSFRAIEEFGNSNELKLTDIRSILRRTNMAHLSFRALADLYAAFRPSWKVELANDRMIFAPTGRPIPRFLEVFNELRRLEPRPLPVGTDALITCGVQFISEDNILYVRPNEWTAPYEQFVVEKNKYMDLFKAQFERNLLAHLKFVFVGDLALFLDHEAAAFRRCQVAGVAADGRVEVDRIDEGGRFVVSPEDLFKLPRKLQQQPPFVVALDSCNSDGTPLPPHVLPKLKRAAENAMQQQNEVIVQFVREDPRPPFQSLFHGTWQIAGAATPPSRSASSTFGGAR